VAEPVALLRLGARVRCTDGPLGELHDIVLDPASRRVTHLGVEVPDEPLKARLVPAELAELSASAGDILLRCTEAEAHALTPLREFAYLRPGEHPTVDAEWTIGVRDLITMPRYEAGAFEGYRPEGEGDVGVIYDRIPKGEAEIRRTSPVLSPQDREIGTVDGLIIDEDRITHLVVRSGHLWRRREVALPVAAVARWSIDEVGIRLSADELRSYPIDPGTPLTA
jgi:uncharacterized protein YrrD